MSNRTRIVIPSGVLGLGFDRTALANGLTLKPDAICIDGGSTDSGPYYLGSGSSRYSESATRSEWRELMQARQVAGVPLVLGSCGTCGSDTTVDWMLEMTTSIAAELGYTLKIACLYSSQSSTDLVQALHDNRIHSLEPKTSLTPEQLQACSNVVALAGAEQIAQALETGADIVLAGRTTDTAVISALPMLRGSNPGPAWHGAKIGECGALCSTQPVSGVICIDFDDDGFEVRPLAEGARCTPHSVSAHMLYENADPVALVEPGGTLDVNDALYTAVDEYRVRVTGSRWHTADRYTVKLEGAILSGYQTTALVLLRQPEYVANARKWSNQLKDFLLAQIKDRMDIGADEFTLEFRLIGIDATLGELEYLKSQPSEVGVLMLVTASTQSLATDITRLCNPFLLHYPLTDTEALPTFAFPYSPAESERGAIYEFALNHVLELSAPMDAFRLTTLEINHGQAL